MRINQEVYRRLVRQHGPIWVDFDGNFWPVKNMSDRRLVNCLSHVQTRIQKLRSPLDTVFHALSTLQGEMALESAEDYLESNLISDDQVRHLERLEALKDWERIFKQELEKRGVRDGQTDPKAQTN